ncbi:MAG: sigma-54 interaction domain-containing protein [Candidatus Cryptobacteroides sp.]
MDSQELQRLKNKYDIIGNDAELNHALETAVAVAPTDLTVLITGESGVGKEVIPKIIHQHSLRKTGKYLAVNCGAIPEGTINAELFGHEKGAFTGAIADRKGYFEEADGGTLFLDEIGELPKETQSMLLRVLQSGEFIKVGSSRVQKTDVRVITATNIKLRTAMERGKFREDLYYRLNAVQIMVPALRERKDDIYLLFRKFSSDFAEKYKLCKISLAIEAISLLKAYRWPGNVRQLKNVAETVTALESSQSLPGASDRIELSAAKLAPYIPNEHDELLPMPAPATGGGAPFGEDEKRVFIKALVDLKQEVDILKAKVDTLSSPTSAPQIPQNAPVQRDDAEWQEQKAPENISIKKANDVLIQRALEKHGGNIKEAAEELGISERTIYRRLAQKKKSK